MYVRLLQCDSLNACDEYFNALVKSKLLGDIEPEAAEVEHLAGIIAQELKENQTNLQGSLTVAFFLVWMGFLFYQEGNYWGPVYQKLGLPKEQTKWQKELGSAFLRVVEKYWLYDFQGEQRYIIPILAHGYIPNWYLEDYFAAIILPTYIHWEEAGLQLQRKEVEHLVLSWRQDHAESEKYKLKLNELESRENELNNICEAWRQRDLLAKLQSLQSKLIHNDELKGLLSFPEDWLDNTGLKQAELKKQYNYLRSCLENYQKIEAEIEAVARNIFTGLDNNFTNILIHLSESEIRALAEKCRTPQGILFRIKSYLLRLFAPAKYRQQLEAKQRLEELLDPLPIKQHIITNPWPVLPDTLLQLQSLLQQRNSIASKWAEITAARREIDVNSTEDLKDLQTELDKLTQELIEYKTKLVKLGKGDMQVGKEILLEQRELRRDIDQLRTQFSQDVDNLLSCFARVIELPSVKEYELGLIEIRRKKREANAKVCSYPLYELNESARVFIFQGGERAVQFVYESFGLMDGLRRGKIKRKISLPKRVKERMVSWWEKEGKDLFEALLVEKKRERKQRTGAIVCKPVLKFDPNKKELKILLPSQPVSQGEGSTAKFYVVGESGLKQEKTLALFVDRATGTLWSEAIELPLEYPEQCYYLQFTCGQVTRSWQIDGIGWDSCCLLFDKDGELVTDGQLPEDSMYIIAPIDSSTAPAGDIREGLGGHWSEYEYRYIDLENTDVVVVRTGKVLSVYRRTPCLEPRLLSDNVLAGIDAEGAPVYQGHLPDLIFSMEHRDEVQFYGVAVDSQGEKVFIELKDILAPEHVKNNIVHLSLADLAKKKYGRYKITLIKRGHVLWSTQCAVVPDLQLNFDQMVYIVHDNFPGKGRLEFSSRHKCAFVPAGEDGVLLTRISPTMVEFDTRLDVIKGSLVYFFATEFSFDINVYVPGIRWRQRDETWKAATEEIWHEDLTEIEVRVPAALGKTINLAIKGNKQVISRPIRQGIAIFDLKGFSDTLRESDEPVQDIIFSCAKKDIPPFVLLRVRSRWQVAKVILTQRLQEGKRHLSLEWVDLGRAVNRLLRLWPIDMPGVYYIEKNIPEGANSLDIIVPVEQMPPGRYRLEFALDDPWGSGDMLVPKEGADNCQNIDIGSKEEILQTYLGKQLGVVALTYDKQEIKLERNYWLEVINYNPAFEGEARLIGNIFSTASDGTVVAMTYNPVSFYLSGREMPFLIDKDGDGVTYCRKCRVLFWEVAHGECGDAVILPDTILIEVGDS